MGNAGISVPSEGFAPTEHVLQEQALHIATLSPLIHQMILQTAGNVEINVSKEENVNQVHAYLAQALHIAMESP